MHLYDTIQLAFPGRYFLNYQDIFESDKPEFSLLQSNIYLNELVPASFRKRFYASTGRPPQIPFVCSFMGFDYSTYLFIPTDSLLLVFLHYSRHLWEFCGFDKVPDASKITRFKQNFLSDLEDLFSHLVDLTEPMYQVIDSSKASMTVFDSSGIEAWVTENNPKYANRIIEQLKAYAKTKSYNSSYDPYRAAYGSMPSHAAANPEIKQLYIDRHFCYAYKISIVTNGLGTSGTLTFTTGTSLKNILILPWTRSPIPLMKINRFMMPDS